MMGRDLLFRCSSLGLLMTEPKTLKEGPLSVGAKTAIRNIAAQDILGIEFEISDRKLEKGKLVEPDSLALFNSVLGMQAVKNVERRSDDFITGECDLEAPDEIIDLKSAWSAATFPICPEDVPTSQRMLYEYQGRGYMRLWNKTRFRVAYCLVDTPEALIGYEPLPLHIVSHIPEHLRVTTWVIERDLNIEAAMVEKVKAARIYYAQVVAEFERTHRPLATLRASMDEAAPAAPTSALTSPPQAPAPAEVAEAAF